MFIGSTVFAVKLREVQYMRLGLKDSNRVEKRNSETTLSVTGAT